MPLEYNKKTIFFAAIIFIIIIICAWLFDTTGITISQILDIKNWQANLAKFFATEFIAMLLILPLAYALAITAMKKHETKETLLIISIAAAIATIISMLIFPDLMYYGIIAIFFIATFPTAMYNSTISFKELKKYILFRGINGSVQKGALLLILGTLIFGAIALMPKTQQMATQFEYGLVEMTMGGEFTATSIDFSEQATNMLIQQQEQALNQITTDTTFQKLREKTDPDVIIFITAMDALAAQINSPAYKEYIAAQIKANQETAIEQMGLNTAQIVNMMKTQFPIMQQLEPWFWLIATMGIIAIIQIAFLIITPLAGIYGLLIEKAYPETQN